NCRLKWNVRYEVLGGSGVEGGAFLDGEVDPAALVERSDPGLARQGRLVAVPRIGPIHEPLRGDGVHPRLQFGVERVVETVAVPFIDPERGLLCLEHLET